MVKVLIAADKDECEELYARFFAKSEYARFLRMVYSEEAALTALKIENTDVFIVSEKIGAKTCLKLRQASGEIKILFLQSAESVTEKCELCAAHVLCIAKDCADLSQYIIDILKSAKREKEQREYLSRVLGENGFADEVVRELIQSNFEFFAHIFEKFEEAAKCEENRMAVKFACIRMMNIAYEYFLRIGFKNKVDEQQIAAAKQILEEKSVSEVILHLKRRYMNIMQFDQKNIGKSHISVTDRIKKYVERNYGNSGLCIGEIAEVFHFSPNYINDIFKSQAGISIPKYIMGIKMTAAKELLENTDMSVKDIALAVGYDKPNYFPRIFKKHFKISPFEYKNKFDGFGEKD